MKAYAFQEAKPILFVVTDTVSLGTSKLHVNQCCKVQACACTAASLCFCTSGIYFDVFKVWLQ